ncbi:MAG: transposase [Pseudolabrys sp.]|nr:transposase [Pseudolabrys sp.]
MKHGSCRYDSASARLLKARHRRTRHDARHWLAAHRQSKDDPCRPRRQIRRAGFRSPGLYRRRHARLQPQRGPTDSAFIDSFNAPVRLECPNQHWVLDVDDVRTDLKNRRRYRNEERPIGHHVLNPDRVSGTPF